MLTATYGETASITANVHRFSESVTAYDKNGNIQSLQRYDTHAASGKTTRTEVYAYSYDHADRLSKVEHTLGGTKVTLAAYAYDNFGRLQSKQYHGSASNKLTYLFIFALQKIEFFAV